MRKIIQIFTLFLITSLSFANTKPDIALDKITFQVTARQWVSTRTALLVVGVNITLTDSDLAKARADIMDKLAKIAKGDWHIVQFDRSQDSSGLEKLTVRAEVRVDQSLLSHVYQNAKAVSKPGANYEVSTIEFQPSLAEIQKAKAELRETLYQKAMEEMARINKIFTGQSYSLNRLFFQDGEIQPQPKAYRAQETVNMMAMGSAAPDLAVSHEIIMTAVVEAASNRFNPEKGIERVAG